MSEQIINDMNNSIVYLEDSISALRLISENGRSDAIGITIEDIIEDLGAVLSWLNSEVSK